MTPAAHLPAIEAVRRAPRQSGPINWGLIGGAAFCAGFWGGVGALILRLI